MKLRNNGMRIPALSPYCSVRPRIVVAIHGKKAEMGKFKALVTKEIPDTEVIIPEKNELIKLTF